MPHEIDQNRLSGAKPNSAKVRIFRGATVDGMKYFFKPYLKRLPRNRLYMLVQVIVSTIHQVSF